MAPGLYRWKVTWSVELDGRKRRSGVADLLVRVKELDSYPRLLGPFIRSRVFRDLVTTDSALQLSANVLDGNSMADYSFRWRYSKLNSSEAATRDNDPADPRKWAGDANNASGGTRWVEINDNKYSGGLSPPALLDSISVQSTPTRTTLVVQGNTKLSFGSEYKVRVCTCVPVCVCAFLYHGVTKQESVNTFAKSRQVNRLQYFQTTVRMLSHISEYQTISIYECVWVRACVRKFEVEVTRLSDRRRSSNGVVVKVS